MENELVIQRKDGKPYRIKNRANMKAFFFPDEWMRFYRQIPERNQLCFDLMIQTGARINEARHIAPADIDSNRNFLHLRITKTRKGKPLGRLIPISSQFKDVLLRYAKKYKMAETDEYPMLTTAQMENSIKKYSRAIEKKEWKDMSSHNIRKTFENWLHALNVDTFKIAKHMGHTLAVADKHYVSPDIFSDEDKRIIRNILGDLYL